METKDIVTGLRVKYVSGVHGDYRSNPLWGGEFGHVVGTITGDPGMIEVFWDNDELNSYNATDLEPLDLP